jgi:hypothetical protein
MAEHPVARRRTALNCMMFILNVTDFVMLCRGGDL